MTDTTVATLSVPIIGDPKQLDAALERAERRLQQFQRQFGDGLPVPKGGGGGGEPSTRGTDRARDSALALAQAEARLAAAQGDAARAAQILESALNDTNRTTLQGLGAQTQLANLQKRAAAEANGTKSAFQQLSSTVSGFGQALGALGFAVGIQQLAAFGASAIQQANELERTEAIMKQLAGTQARYAELTALAAQNQSLFGGSLNSNLTPLNALLQLSNRTGAELQSLNEAAQLLLVSAPGKAFEDASFSLSEFLSQNGAEAALSLAEQFNLPKQALAELAAEGTSAQERLAGLEALLAQQGVTAATLAAGLDTTAATYSQLGVAFDNLKTQAGSLLAEGLEPLAAFGAQGAQGLAEFLTILQGGNGQLAQQQAALATSAGSYEEYRAAAEEARTAGEAQAQALVGSIPFFGQAAVQVAGLVADTGILSEAEYEQAVAAEAAAAAEAERAVQTGVAAGETQSAAAAANAASIEQLAQAAAAEQTAMRHDELAQAIEQAAAASGSAEAAAAAIASQFEGVEAPAVVALINLHRELAAARAQAAAAPAVSPAYTARTYGGAMSADARRAMEQSRASQEAMRQEAVRELQQKYDRARKPPSARGGSGGKGKGRGGKSEAEKAAEQEAKAAERLNEQLLDIQDRYYDQAADAEERYQERRLSIIEQFAEKRAQAEQDYADQQVEDRLSFYKSLKSIDDQAIRQQASAEYEAFAQKANELRDTKGADVAAEYEAEAARIAAARAQRAEEIKKAEEDAKKDRSKAGDLQYLKDLDKMERDAEQRRLDRISEGKGSLKDEEAAALADAELQRQEALAEAAATAGEAMTEAQQSFLERTQETNTALADQVALLDQIRQRGGGPGGAGTPPATTPAPATPPPTTPAEPTPASGTNPGAVAADIASLLAPLDAIRRAVTKVEDAVKRLGADGLKPGA